MSTINITLKEQCQFCPKEEVFSLGNLLSCLSDLDINGMYDTYTSLSFETGISFKDIDEMYPSERAIVKDKFKKLIESRQNHPS